jgi:hypothetical protein
MDALRIKTKKNRLDGLSVEQDPIIYAAGTPPNGRRCSIAVMPVVNYLISQQPRQSE